jgi:hypothetical protein
MAALAGPAAIGALAGPPPAGDTPRFPSPTGLVEYLIQAQDRRGTGVLSWSEHGRLFRYEGRFQAVGPALAVRRWGYWCLARDGHLFLHSADRGPEIVRMALPRARPGPSLLALTPVPIPSDVGEMTGRETILGRPCRILTLRKARVWVHGGLPLRIELERSGGNRSVMTARQIDLVARLESSRFRLPPRARVIDSQVPELAP